MPNERAIGNIEIVESSTAFNGKNYLLAIGIDKYRDANFTNLNNAVSDAKKVVQILTEKYGFEDEPEFLLFDDKATRRAIISTLETVVQYFDAAPDQDNLIVYFSGHGDYNRRTNIGYRIPVDAEYPHSDSYIEDSTILDRIKSIKAKHILLISDSCFSGSMIRGQETNEFRFEEHTERLPSRHIITSGLLQTVSDGMRDDYSPFARALITYLEATPKAVLPFSDVAQHIKHNVPQNANGQIPYYGTLDFAGNYGGEFVLHTKNVELTEWNALDKNNLAALKAFIAKYPKSTKRAEAQQNIDRIKAEAQQLKLETEKRAYEYAKASPTIYKLNQFIKDNPKSNFTPEMEDLLAEAEENAAWKEAKNKNTITGYRQFLRNFPNTDLKDDAQNRIGKIEYDVDSNESEQLSRIKNEELQRLAAIETDKRESERLAKLETDKIERQRLEELEIEKQERERLTKAKKQKQDSERVVKQKTPQLKQVQTQKISTTTITWSSVLTFLAFAVYMAFKFGLFAPKTVDKPIFSNLPTPTYLMTTPIDTVALKKLTSPNTTETQNPNTGANKPLVANNDFNPEMIFIQGGTFKMGSNEGEESEKPVHNVTVSDFNIGRYEVTQAQWKAVMSSNPSNAKGDNLPVENVSWDDVQEFLKKLNAKTGKNYRLPTEAEWEFAARGGVKSKNYKYSGSNSATDVAWVSENSNNITHTVGSLKANELDIFDMSGNVWEWCQDLYDENYYKNSPPLNPKGSSSREYRVLRGGSCGSDSNDCRVANRGRNYLSNRFSYYGFRVTRYN